MAVESGRFEAGRKQVIQVVSQVAEGSHGGLIFLVPLLLLPAEFNTLATLVRILLRRGLSRSAAAEVRPDDSSGPPLLTVVVALLSSIFPSHRLIRLLCYTSGRCAASSSRTSIGGITGGCCSTG